MIKIKFEVDRQKEIPLDPVWEKLPSLPNAMYGHSMVQWNNGLYVYGGVINGVVSNKLLYLDLNGDNDWVELTTTGTSYGPVQGHCAAVSPNGLMFVAGGTTNVNVSSSSGTLATFKRLNLNNMSWINLNNLSTTVRVSEMVFWNNFISFSRGLNASTAPVTPNTYNMLDNSFVAPFAGNLSREYFSGMCNANGQIHNHGGARTGTAPMDAVSSWRHTKGGNWVIDSDITPAMYANKLEPLNDEFFVFSGLARNVNAAASTIPPQERFFRFDPDTKIKTNIAPPPEHKNIYQFATASNGNELFQSGGQYNSDYDSPTSAPFTPNAANMLITNDVWKVTFPDVINDQEGTWEKLPDYPQSYGITPIVLKSVVVGNFLYTFTSSYTTSTNTVVYKLNIETNEWVSLGTYNNKLDPGNSSCSVHGKIVYFFGTNHSSATNQVSRFDTETESFLSSFNAPVSPGYGTAGVTIGDEIWFIGGYTSSPTNIARVHNPVTNTWREEAMAGSPNTWFGSAVNYNGQPSIGFGDSSTISNRSRLYIRNEQGEWGVKSIIPNQIPKVFGRLNKIGKFIYISGFGNTATSCFTRLNVERNTWVSLNAPFTSHQFLSTADDGNSIFVLCGRNESSMTTPVRDVWKFTPKYK